MHCISLVVWFWHRDHLRFITAGVRGSTSGYVTARVSPAAAVAAVRCWHRGRWRLHHRTCRAG